VADEPLTSELMDLGTRVLPNSCFSNILREAHKCNVAHFMAWHLVHVASLEIMVSLKGGKASFSARLGVAGVMPLEPHALIKYKLPIKLVSMADSNRLCVEVCW
jgi:hypothetical protein